MTIECRHLRKVGVIQDKHKCCPRCHSDAGLVVTHLPGGHKAVYCCARPEPFTDAEIAAILAKIPEWEQEMNGN